LVKRLAEQGIDVVSFSRGGYHLGLDEFIGAGLRHVRFVRGDVLNLAEIRKAIKDYGVEIFIHAAAVTPATPPMERTLSRQTVQVNIEGTVNTLEAVMAEGVKRFIYVSSISVYGQQDPGKPIIEDAYPQPKVLYAITKYSGELLSLRYSELFNKLDVRIVRISSIYGPMERPTKTRHVLSYIYEWCTAAVLGKTVEVWDDTNLKRDFTYVDDTVDGIILVSFTSSPKYKVYNISSGKPFSLLEVLNTIKKIEPSFQFSLVSPIGKEGSMRTIPLGPLDITRAQLELGYKPKYNLENGLRNYIEWLRNHFPNEMT
jgi:nucleoside-diphosphate-sugar epimerase